jgi:hypothetical protein
LSLLGKQEYTTDRTKHRSAKTATESACNFPKQSPGYTKTRFPARILSALPLNNLNLQFLVAAWKCPEIKRGCQLERRLIPPTANYCFTQSKLVLANSIPLSNH